MGTFSKYAFMFEKVTNLARADVTCQPVTLCVNKEVEQQAIHTEWCSSGKAAPYHHLFPYHWLNGNESLTCITQLKHTG